MQRTTRAVRLRARRSRTLSPATSPSVSPRDRRDYGAGSGLAGAGAVSTARPFEGWPRWRLPAPTNGRPGRSGSRFCGAPPR